MIPVYKNAETLCELYAELTTILQNSFAPYEILFINDASPDRSGEILLTLSQEHPEVRTLSLQKNVGQNYAILKGLSISRGNCAVILDADLQDPPSAIPHLLSFLAQGADAVFAARRGIYESQGRLFASQLFKWILHKISGAPMDAGLYVALNRPTIDRLLAIASPLSYIVGMIGLTAKEIRSFPVPRNIRPKGVSAYSCWKRFRLGFRALFQTILLKIRLSK